MAGICERGTVASSSTVVGRQRASTGKAMAPGLPELEFLVGVFGHMHGRSAVCPEHLFNGLGVVRHLGGVAVNLDEQDGRGLARQTRLGEVVHAHDGVVVQKFQGTGQHVSRNDPGHGFGGFLHVVEDSHQRLGGPGRGHQLQDGLGNNAQRALGLDHHARQIIAGDALHGARAGFDYLAGGVEKLHAHDIVLGHAVFEPAQAPGVFRDIAADGGYGLGAGIRRIKKILFGNGRGKVRGDHARLHHGIQIIEIDLKDAVPSRWSAPPPCRSDPGWSRPERLVPAPRTVMGMPLS